MRVFKDIKLVEQLESGVQRILKVYDRSIFKISSNFLKVSFPIKNVGKNVGVNVGKKIIKLNSTQERIIELVMQNKYITQEEMSKKLNMSVRTIQRNIKRLQTENIVVRIGANKVGYWNVVK